MKRTPLKGVSQRQALLNARWSGMKDMAWYMSEGDVSCYFCDKLLRSDDIIDAHHVVPRSKGGSYDPDNLVLVHRACHSSEHGEPMWGAQ